MRFVILSIWIGSLGFSQAPTGTIAGIVTDPSGATVRDARVKAVNRETGLSRSTASGPDGGYSFPALLAGSYAVRAEADGFRPLVRDALVEAGNTTTAHLSLELGSVADAVTVQGAAPQIKYDQYKLDGVVQRAQVESLPLNGRSFVELAKLEPGVTIANAASRVDVSALGAARSEITIDGGKVNHFVDGNSHNKLSQEIVEEFQIATVNFDLSSGAAAGAINIVTRSGGNDFHGSGFYLYRDHKLAAYPALRRDPSNPDPFFRRWQSGFNAGGPIRRNRIFFFGAFERNHQDGVSGVQPAAPEFAPLGGIFPVPIRAKQYSLRMDAQVDARNTLLARYSHDDIDQVGVVANRLPSNWTDGYAPNHQAVAAWTAAWRANLVSELRLSFNYWGQRTVPLGADRCPGCLGLDIPLVTISGAAFGLGQPANVPSTQFQRTYQIGEALTWQKGKHAMRFGGGWERDFPSISSPVSEPASITLYAPSTARAARLPVPVTFSASADFLALPLLSFQTGVGDPKVPPSYNYDRAKQWSIWRLYWQDTWRLHPRFTLNLGAGYTYDTFRLNHDLSKPEYLRPILGQDGLQPSRKDPNNVGPAAGFAWSATKDNKTVIRGGAGIYYDLYLWVSAAERTTLGPRGTGHSVLDGSLAPNPIPGIPGVPVGRALDFRLAPTAFTGANLLSILPSVRATLQRIAGDPRNTDLSIRNIEVFKQQNSTGGLFAQDYTSAYSEHFNLGMQRRIASDLVVSADFAFRQFVHTDMSGIDLNRWNSLRGPVIPACAGDQSNDPKAQCSTGPILVNMSGGRSHYKALLVKLDKRFSHRTQFLASYALSSNVGFNGPGNGFNNENWFDSFGPLDVDRRHVLNVAGIVELPRGFQLSFISAFASRPPFTAYLANLDLNGDGQNGDALPGAGVNRLNRSLNASDLAALVDRFNQTLAGTRTSRGQTVPKLALPDRFELGHNSISQDVRVSRVFRAGERAKVTLFGEVFNVLNFANLSGYSGNLQQTPNFGQPTARASQVFGSGGPRAFQLGARVSF